MTRPRGACRSAVGLSPNGSVSPSGRVFSEARGQRRWAGAQCTRLAPQPLPLLPSPRVGGKAADSAACLAASSVASNRSLRGLPRARKRTYPSRWQPSLKEALEPQTAQTPAPLPLLHPASLPAPRTHTSWLPGAPELTCQCSAPEESCPKSGLPQGPPLDRSAVAWEWGVVAQKRCWAPRLSE